MRQILLCLTLAAPLAAQGPNAPVVINEFSYDDSSTDDREFVELYNASGAMQDISGWVLDSEDELGSNTPITIPASTMLAPGTFYLFGGSLVTGANQTVPDGTWENSQESLTLRDASGAIVDTLIYEGNKGLWTPLNAAETLYEGEPIWGNFVSIDASTLAALPILTSWSRAKDGVDSGNNGHDFVLAPSTPGASNSSGWTTTLPYADNFDLGTADQPAVNYIGSFEFPYVVDPTVPGSYLVGWLPSGPSPQGGKCLALWDTAGGGDTGVLLAEVDGNVVFEAYAYFDAGAEASVNAGTSICLTGAGEFEHQSWSVGIGGIDTFHNWPDPSGVINAAFGTVEANGNTGVAWLYQITDLGGTLYLMDHNDGGWGAGAQTLPTILGSINIVAGSNDGWQRIRLERTGNTVIGTFGGTLGSGCADGTNIVGTVGYNGPSTLYLGYREFICDNNNDTHPLLLDAVSMRASTSDVQHFGTAYAHNFGGPVIAANSPPTIGNTSWAITGSSMVPSSNLGVVILGQTKIPVPIPGGIPGSTSAFLPIVLFGVTSDASGNATFQVPIACNPGFLGATLSWQLVDLDVTLPFMLPLGLSDGLDTTFGN